MRTTTILHTFVPRLALLLAAAACSADRLAGAGSLPPTVSDPTSLDNPAGAITEYRGALVTFREAVDQAVSTSGVLSDELQSGSIGQPVGVWDDWATVDSRVLPEFTDPYAEASSRDIPAYSVLQAARGQANQAQGLVEKFGGDSLRPLAGHLQVLKAYAEVYLADLYCSGVPLSTVDYGGDYTLAAGSTTEEVYRHAVALFDSALAVVGDSARVRDLARVGRGRALLALGQYADAAQAVAEVPDGFTYRVTFADQDRGRNFAWANPGPASRTPWQYSVSDREGINGLDYRSSADPRAKSVAVGQNIYGQTVYRPAKYGPRGDSAIVVADWIEARLIGAEAALKGGDASWLATLNTLRETAISPALPDTTDPGTPEARLSLLFRERAFWLFLTGHRQGDLRRLVREYGLSASAEYPTGTYAGGPGAYGSAVDVPVPAAERAGNYKYTGCINRGA